jgi:hypothetical protein
MIKKSDILFVWAFIAIKHPHEPLNYGLRSTTLKLSQAFINVIAVKHM